MSIGLGIGITDEAEFNRRAAIALNSCTLSGFAKRLHIRLKTGKYIDLQDQRWLYRLVHERRNEITAEALREYADQRRREAD